MDTCQAFSEKKDPHTISGIEVWSYYLNLMTLGKKAPAFFEFKRMTGWSIIRAYEKMGEMMDYETEGIAERNILHSSAGE